MEKEFIICGPAPATELVRESIGAQLYKSLIKHRNETIAMTDVVSGKSISYQTILEKSCRLAYSLQRFGIGRDDVVAMFSENNLNYFYPVCAALYLGNVVTLFNPNYSTGEILHAVNISKPTIVFCSETYVQKIVEMKHQLPTVRQIIVIDSKRKSDQWVSLEDFIENSQNVDVLKFKLAEFDIDEQIAFILYSSGTTGIPKGVMLSHLNMIYTFDTLRDPRYSETNQSGDSSTLGLLPFFHTFGLFAILLSLLEGRLVAILSSFDPQVFLRAIQDYKIGTLYIVPPLANFLAKSALVDQYDLSSVKWLYCGAAPLGKELLEQLLKRVKPTMFHEIYAMTESLAIIMKPLSDPNTASVGKVVPNAMVKVVDVESGKSLGPGVEGELCFKGPMIMKGYVGDIKATQQAIDDNGWLHSGDVGYYEEDGHFYVVDRLKELIKYKGFQVPPAELEAILVTHPKIQEAGVVGQPDERAGEVPVAFVVTAPNQTLTEEEVKDFVAQQVSIQKHLRGGVRFVSEIPKNPSGKILRRRLRELLKPNAKSTP